MKKTLFAIMCIFATVACAQQTTVKGHFDDLGAEEVQVLCLKATFDGYEDPITIPAKGGDFEWNADYQEARLAFIAAKPKEGERFGQNGYAKLVIIPGESITVSGTPKEETVMSPFNTEANTFEKKISKIDNDDEIAALAAEYINANPSNPASVYMVQFLNSNVDATVDKIAAEAKEGVTANMYNAFLKQAKHAEEMKEKRKDVADGMPAPDFTLDDINGKPLALSSLQGKYVILDFWGSWCIWCIRGIPKMKEYYAKYNDKLEILGVDCNDKPEKWKAAVKQHSIPWLHVYNPKDSNLLEKYAIEGFPTKIVIDPKGNIVKTVVGEDPAFYEFLDNLFK